MKHCKLFYFVIVCIFIFPIASFAASITLEKYYFKTDPVEYSKNRLYAVFKNTSTTEDFFGTVKIVCKTNSGQDLQFGDSQIVSIFAGGEDGVFFDDTIKFAGNVSCSIPVKNGSGSVVDTPNVALTIEPDTDMDGTGNNKDTDDDADGLLDSDEIAKGTNPLVKDTDGDSVPDGGDVFPKDKTEWQDVDADGTGDNADTDDDNDGITDTVEKSLGTNPLKVDTDGDGIKDNEEIAKGTNPTNPDTDGDGMPDGEEIKKGENPLVSDIDHDGISDEVEKKFGFSNDDDDSKKDSDGDGVSNKDEVLKYFTNPAIADSDSDGLDDKKEVESGANPAVVDTDSDGILDGKDDWVLSDKNGYTDDDGDGVLSILERKYGMNYKDKTTFWIVPDKITYFVLRYKIFIIGFLVLLLFLKIRRKMLRNNTQTIHTGKDKNNLHTSHSKRRI